MWIVLRVAGSIWSRKALKLDFHSWCPRCQFELIRVYVFISRYGIMLMQWEGTLLYKMGTHCMSSPLTWWRPAGLRCVQNFKNVCHFLWSHFETVLGSCHRELFFISVSFLLPCWFPTGRWCFVPGPACWHFKILSWRRIFSSSINTLHDSPLPLSYRGIRLCQRWTIRSRDWLVNVAKYRLVVLRVSETCGETHIRHVYSPVL